MLQHRSAGTLRRALQAKPAAAAAAASISSVASTSLASTSALSRVDGHYHQQRRAVSSSALSSSEMDDMFKKRERILGPVLTSKQNRLKKLESWKEMCDSSAATCPDTYMWGVFAFLSAQAAVLFDWTYVHFDWNLVEPITYLIGYSATWMALAWYGNLHQSEYSHDSVRRLLQASRQKVLYKKYGVNMEELARLRDEVELLERIMRSNNRGGVVNNKIK